MFIKVKKSIYKLCAGKSELIPDDGSVLVIGDYAFYNNDKILNITLPRYVSSIGDFAFAECSKLQSVTVLNIAEEDEASAPIHNGVEQIGENAFLSCTKLETITLGNRVKSIGEAAFKNCSALTDIVIPEGVTEIEIHTFDLCSKLKTVTLPSTLTRIGEYAFYKCTQLKTPDIPESVTTIERSAFAGCLLSCQTIDGVTYVDNWVLEYNNGSVLRDGTVGIAEGAFDSKVPSRLTIPVTLRYVCHGCYIELIIYEGTSEQWEAIWFNEGSKLEYEEIQFSKDS